MNKIFNAEEAFNAYFSGVPIDAEAKIKNSDKIKPYAAEKDVYENKTAKTRHFVEKVPGTEYTVENLRAMADNYISDIEMVADILKRLCNAAWGDGWGELSPDLKKGEDSSNIILPQIVVDMNGRDISDISGLKPKLMDVIQEEDRNGNQTGDSFLIYRQWFDCNIEFDFYGRTNKEARELQTKLESLITVYAGYLKRHGISEMFFEREVSPKFSLNYDETVPMRCIFYYVRLERITPVRHSLINNINVELGAGRLSSEKIKLALDDNSGNNDPIDLAFFDGDTGLSFTTKA